MTRVVSNLLLALVLTFGMPLAVPAAAADDGCTAVLGLDADAGTRCDAPKEGMDMKCCIAGGTCQISAVFPFDTAVPATSAESTHPFPTLSPYHSPDLSTLFRPPIIAIL